MKDQPYTIRRKISSFRLLREQRGQALPIMTFMMITLLGMGALSIDFGRAFVSYRQLQSSTDAAALAGAQQLPNTTNATSVATNFSAGSGDDNAYNWMKSVSVTASAYCSSTAQGWGLPCVGSTGVNVLKVTESYSVPTYFARLFGINSIPIAATASAAMNGSAPWNIVVIVDTTDSMNTVDSSSECSSQTRIACALQGVQAFLLDSNLYPCAATSGCGGSDTQTAETAIPAYGNYPNPLNRVALFTFPVLETNGTNPIDDDFNCSGTNPTISPKTSTSQYGGYQYPKTSDTSYAPPASGILLNPTPSPTSTQGAYNASYQVVGFSTDYKTSNSATTLNPSSYIVDAVGGKSGCTAMGAPGGLGTYYAGVIYAAQAALVAEQKSYPGSLNAIVLVSDGDATSACTEMGATSTSCTSPAPNGATSGGTYPSWVDECSQAITAAQAAATAGTRVYTVAYGAETSGCTTDTSGTYSGITPCQTLKDMASSSAYFFSDYDQSGSGIDSSCVGTGSLDTSLSTIFQEIASSLSNARLIPSGTS